MRVLAAATPAGPITLEPLMRGHAAEMFELLCDPALHEFEGRAPASAEWLAERYAQRESRSSPDGMELWLNWVVRLGAGPDRGRLAGYVQATVLPTDDCFIAYELGSRHWRQGIGSAAVRAMLAELRAHYGVRRFVAVLKAANHRSLGLLQHLGFGRAGTSEQALYCDSHDELVMACAATDAH
ncbi:MAG: GNAT family N-acetyltransferase [Pelomonas sp.]|nr:GNAT family N-acetyltransferase [Roseateles sp.]